MESSFLEDLLTREVDQNQVNALVGSLEDQLTAPRSSAAPSTTSISIKSDNITSISQLVSQSVPRKVTVTSVPINLSTAGYRYVKAPPISAQSNGSVSFDTKLLSKSNLASSHTSIPNNVIISSSPKPVTPPVSRQPVSLIVNNNTVSSQVSIAPKITNTVPIAPRIGTNIMITPRHAQLLMAQRLGPNAALLQSNLIAQMPGGIPVVPRIPGSAIAVPPIMNTQIPGIRTVVGHRGPSIINMTQKTDPRMRINSQIPVSSLAQVKSNANIIPGQINYRFRQVNPSSSAVTSQVTTVNGVTPQAGAAANITVLKESVKRLKEFFQNLINLACGPNQPPEIGKMVKELVHNLMVARKHQLSDLHDVHTFYVTSSMPSHLSTSSKLRSNISILSIYLLPLFVILIQFNVHLLCITYIYFAERSFIQYSGILIRKVLDYVNVLRVAYDFLAFQGHILGMI